MPRGGLCPGAARGCAGSQAWRCRKLSALAPWSAEANQPCLRLGLSRGGSQEVLGPRYPRHGLRATLSPSLIFTGGQPPHLLIICKYVHGWNTPLPCFKRPRLLGPERKTASKHCACKQHVFFRRSVRFQAGESSDPNRHGFCGHRPYALSRTDKGISRTETQGREGCWRVVRKGLFLGLKEKERF